MLHGDGFAECEKCHRHVLGRDRACPFCGAEISAAIRPIAQVPGARPARLAILAGALVAGCTSAVSHPSYGFAGPFDDVPLDTVDAGDDAADDAPSLIPGDAALDDSDAER